MIRRHELSDAEWEFVPPLLPESLRGRKRLDDREVLNGIVWKFRTGTAWRDVPERYGPWAAPHTWFRRWALDGTFGRMLRPARGPGGRRRGHRLARVGRLHRRPRPPARRRGAKRGLRGPALGRFRGALTSEIHLACDAMGRPLAFTVTGGNINDCTRFTAVTDAIRVPRLGPGRPRNRPGHVLGAKGYSSKAIRARLRRRGVGHTHPGTGRPDPQPAPARQPRRTAAGLRQTPLQAARRGRTPLQPLEALARHRHPLRQDRRVLPSSRHLRLAPDVGVTFEVNS